MMVHRLGGGQQRDVAGAAFNATEFAACDHTVSLDGHDIKVPKQLLARVIGLLQIREHDGQMFAHELKADETVTVDETAGRVHCPRCDVWYLPDDPCDHQKNARRRAATRATGQASRKDTNS